MTYDIYLSVEDSYEPIIINYTKVVELIVGISFNINIFNVIGKNIECEYYPGIIYKYI